MTNSEPVRILADRAAIPALKRELSRRRFFSIAGLAGAGALLAACGGGGGTGSGDGAGTGQGGADSGAPRATGGPVESTLSMYSWGDYDSPDVLKAFTDKFGTKLVIDAFGSNEELIAKLVAAKGTGGYDIIVPTGAYVPQMVHNGLLMKLNKDLIPNLVHMDPAFLNKEWDPTGDYSICKAWGTTGFAYDTSVIKRELKTWNDFLDCAQKEASGKTSVLDDPAEITGMYFWANGIDWNTTDPAQLDAAEKFLVSTLAPHIAAFDSVPGTGALPQSTQALIQIWNGDARQGILQSSEPDKWQWVLGAPDTELWMDNWAISATAPHPEAAHAFINFVLQPDMQLENVDYIGYHTGAKDIEKTARDEGFEMIDLIFFTPEQLATMHEGKVTEATERIVDIYNKVKAAASA